MHKKIGLIIFSLLLAFNVEAQTIQKMGLKQPLSFRSNLIIHKAWTAETSNAVLATIKSMKETPSNNIKITKGLYGKKIIDFGGRKIVVSSTGIFAGSDIKIKKFINILAGSSEVVSPKPSTLDLGQDDLVSLLADGFQNINDLSSMDDIRNSVSELIQAANYTDLIASSYIIQEMADQIIENVATTIEMMFEIGAQYSNAFQEDYYYADGSSEITITSTHLDDEGGTVTRSENTSYDPNGNKTGSHVTNHHSEDGGSRSGDGSWTNYDKDGNVTGSGTYDTDTDNDGEEGKDCGLFGWKCWGDDGITHESEGGRMNILEYYGSAFEQIIDAEELVNLESMGLYGDYVENLVGQYAEFNESLGLTDFKAQFISHMSPYSSKLIQVQPFNYSIAKEGVAVKVNINLHRNMSSYDVYRIRFLK